MAAVTLKVRDNGPYRVEGPFALVDAEGNAFPLAEGQVVVLCRCGHSEEKPFCDASHRRVGFESRPRAPRAEEGAGSA